jgi:hypothetical protein
VALVGGIASGKIFEVNMTHTTRYPKKKPLLFPVPQDDVEERILTWIRGIVQSNHQLVGVLERLRHSYKALLAGKPVTDSEKILWQVEVAVKDAEKSKKALDSLGGRVGHNNRAVRPRLFPRSSPIRRAPDLSKSVPQ